MENILEVLQTALDTGRPVKFIYRAKDGSTRTREGKVTVLTDKIVKVYDIHRDADRTSILTGIESEVTWAD